MPKTSSLPIIGYLTAGILIFLAQTHLLWYSGFYDYDSARNWQIVQEIGHGNFAHLFQHASPTFFLFYALFTPIFKNFQLYIFLNCLFNVLAILFIVRFIEREFSLPAFSTFLLLLFSGLSCFLTVNGRNFTIEAPSLLLFALILPLYYKRFTEQNSHAFLQTVGLLALGLTINYKLLLLLPVAIVLELLPGNKNFKVRYYTYAALILLLPYLFYALVAISVELPFYQFPAAFIKINDFTTPTPGSRTGRFNFEFTYYLNYLTNFESPLLVVGLLLFPVLFRQFIFNKLLSSPLNIYRYLFIIIVLFLAGMHLLLKSPRGLFLIYNLLYAITFISCARLVRHQLIVAFFISLSIIYQALVLQREIYTYAHTNYSKVITYLQKQRISKVATTVGLGITPFAQAAGIEIATVFDENQLPALKTQGYQHVLLDDYYLTANIRKFKKLETISPLASWPEWSLLPPYLYLDQSEFTGFSYKKALQSQQQAAQDSIQLRLLSIP